ncbi:hypothetical protein GLOIN_2v1702868 [Rhizophagus clarus]|uniref:Uncharacterized protein n=1 Tax=Rhizophagus clarus TaxID=94130 RepID=A0A8H3QWG5_9GLOM|nr:hypothetical protein GLOIN_2v1702868 [Rhizophagus clarus]
MIYYFCLGTSLSLEIKSLIAETPTTYTKFYTKNAILIILLLSKYCKAQKNKLNLSSITCRSVNQKGIRYIYIISEILFRTQQM